MIFLQLSVVLLQGESFREIIAHLGALRIEQASFVARLKAMAWNHRQAVPNEACRVITVPIMVPLGQVPGCAWQGQLALLLHVLPVRPTSSPSIQSSRALWSLDYSQ